MCISARSRARAGGDFATAHMNELACKHAAETKATGKIPIEVKPPKRKKGWKKEAT